MRTGKRILIIDDEEDWREIIRGMFDEEEFEVQAVDESEALRLINEGTYDYIFLDIMMARKSGQEVFTELRALDQRSVVIVLSNLGRNDEKVRWFIEKNVQFYTKGEDGWVENIKAYMAGFKFKDVEEVSVLIVDDEESKRETYAGLLRAHNFTDIEVCSSLEEAEQRVTEREFDVYLIDVCYREHGMPVPKGVDFITALLQQRGGGPGLIIPISTYPEVRDRLPALSTQASVRPLLLEQPEQFEEQIDTVLLRGRFLVQHA